MHLTFNEYVDLANRLMQKYSDLRIGQCFTNTLWNVRPDISRKIHGSDIDPYYDDKKVQVFLDYVERNW